MKEVNSRTQETQECLADADPRGARLFGSLHEFCVKCLSVLACIAHKSLKICAMYRLSVSNRQRLGWQGERPQSLNFDSVASADRCDRHYSAIENGLGSLVA